MKKSLLFLCMLPLALLSCSDYGKKVEVSDTLDVYIKGQATEEEAKKLGNYIATLAEDKKERSLQLSKEAETYTVKMVVDETAAAAPGMDQKFMALRFLISENVFPGSPLKMVVTDNGFNDIKSVKDTVFTQ